MADLAVAPPATDLFGEPIEAHPPWFKPDSFLRADFDPDAYVAGLRFYVPLESLAAELRSHLAALRAELVGLINRDYADFVGLSARLKGVDAAAARMRAPLADPRGGVRRPRRSPRGAERLASFSSSCSTPGMSSPRGYVATTSLA